MTQRAPVWHVARAGLATALVAFAIACNEGPVAVRSAAAVTRVDSLTAPPGNLLVRRVFATITGADSAWIEVASASDVVRRSPAVSVRDGGNQLLIAGLRQAEEYGIRVLTRSRSGVVSASAEISLRTDSLPIPLRRLRFTVTGTASTGLTILPVKLDSTGYIVAFDSLGAIRWYFDASTVMPNAAVGDIKQLRSGGFLAYVGLTSGWQPVAGRFVRIALDGSIVDGIAPPAPMYTDNHEIIPLYVGDSLSGSIFAAYDLRTLDMTAYGGSPTARIAGHYILRQQLTGAVDFFWSAWDNLSVADWIEEPAAFKSMSPIDFDHPNAIALDRDGNYLVSWRNLAEVTKIDARSGAMLWRWGGANNQFTMVGDPLGFFSGQHSIQVLENGNYLLFDNGLRHAPPESRAVEYRVDPVARTATMVWQFRHSPAIYTAFTGSVQRLANGNTLIGWAAIATVSEVTPNGQVAWEGSVSAPAGVSTYRIKRIPGLYAGTAP